MELPTQPAYCVIVVDICGQWCCSPIPTFRCCAASSCPAPATVTLTRSDTGAVDSVECQRYSVDADARPAASSSTTYP